MDVSTQGLSRTGSFQRSEWGVCLGRRPLRQASQIVKHHFQRVQLMCDEHACGTDKWGVCEECQVIVDRVMARNSQGKTRRFKYCEAGCGNTMEGNPNAVCDRCQYYGFDPDEIKARNMTNENFQKYLDKMEELLGPLSKEGQQLLQDSLIKPDSVGGQLYKHFWLKATIRRFKDVSSRALTVLERVHEYQLETGLPGVSMEYEMEELRKVLSEADEGPQFKNS